MSVFTSKGTIAREFCGHVKPRWVLREHNTHRFLRAYDSFEACLEDVYPSTIQYHRNPTPAEIRFGHGAIHYRDFSPKDCVHPSGKLKQWFKASDDGLRYYL